MNPLSHLCAPVSVPYRHTVRAVAPVARVTLDLTGPLNPHAKSSHQEKPRAAGQASGGYAAGSAAPGFAAQVLVEAGLTGTDPFAGSRAAKAYDSRRAPITTLRLVA
jgi:hypothetical protein